MKLYWRYKKDGKWTWKPADKLEAMERFSLIFRDDIVTKMVEEE